MFCSAKFVVTGLRTSASPHRFGNLAKPSKDRTGASCACFSAESCLAQARVCHPPWHARRALREAQRELQEEDARQLILMFSFNAPSRELACVGSPCGAEFIECSRRRSERRSATFATSSRDLLDGSKPTLHREHLARHLLPLHLVLVHPVLRLHVLSFSGKDITGCCLGFLLTY